MITFEKQIAKKPVRNANGQVIKTVDVETGFDRIVEVLSEGSEELKQQVAWLHPNGYVSFIIPDPPREYQDEVADAVKDHLGRAPLAIGAPGPIE